METKITKQLYETALERIEELLPLVDDETSSKDKNAIELKLMSDIVINYEKEHYPIHVPSFNEVMKQKMTEQNLSQRAFAKQIGVSPSRISEYVSGKAEPTLKIARSISKSLNIDPAIVLGI